MDADAVNARIDFLSKQMPCGHPGACVSGEGTTYYCMACAREAEREAAAYLRAAGICRTVSTEYPKGGVTREALERAIKMIEGEM